MYPELTNVQDFTFNGEKLLVPQAAAAAEVVAHDEPAGHAMHTVAVAVF